MSPQVINYEWIAPEGKIWRCTVCQKLAKYRAGYLPGFPATLGWNDNCNLSAVLENEDQSEHGNDTRPNRPAER